MTCNLLQCYLVWIAWIGLSRTGPAADISDMSDMSDKIKNDERKWNQQLGYHCCRPHAVCLNIAWALSLKLCWKILFFLRFFQLYNCISSALWGGSVAGWGHACLEHTHNCQGWVTSLEAISLLDLHWKLRSCKLFPLSPQLNCYLPWFDNSHFTEVRQTQIHSQIDTVG